MYVTLYNSQRTQSTKLCYVVLEFWGSSGKRSRQRKVCRVVQGLSYNLILGIQQLDEFNPILDSKSRTVQVQGLSI